GGNRSLSTDFGTTWTNVTLGLDADTNAVVQIDPTPGLLKPLVFTHSQIGTGPFAVFFKALDTTSGWTQASPYGFSVTPPQLDHTTNPARHALVVTLGNSQTLMVLSDVRANLGNLPLLVRTPPILASSNGVSDAHANADRSELQPDTIYYTTAGSRPS